MNVEYIFMSLCHCFIEIVLYVRLKNKTYYVMALASAHPPVRPSVVIFSFPDNYYDRPCGGPAHIVLRLRSDEFGSVTALY